MRKLLLLTVGVALAHAFLLWALPATMHPESQTADLVQPATASSFVTRSIAPPAVASAAIPIAPPEVPAPAPRVRTEATGKAVPAIDAVKKVEQVAKPLAAKKDQSQEAPAALATAAPPAEVVAPEAALLASTLPREAPAREPVTDAPIPTTLQLAAASVAADTDTKSLNGLATESRSPARQASTVVPPAARMLYEGKGEEKGFMSYSAGGELVWAPDGAQYTAKLEITFLMARLRTWTSRGALVEGGLQPIRFGDRPRGAEKATHFQRDKGIISFSANNPDVPLQPGAQDKLSAILQLSALIAGAPARFGAGSSISFQAADAHRAELWQFQVGGTEMLELPGGTLNGFKLTKQPTVDFDQRIEVWLAPDMGYLPVRLRITETSGTYVDLLWRKTLKPE